MNQQMETLRKFFEQAAKGQYQPKKDTFKSMQEAGYLWPHEEALEQYERENNIRRY